MEETRGEGKWNTNPVPGLSRRNAGKPQDEIIGVFRPGTEAGLPTPYRLKVTGSEGDQNPLIPGNLDTYRVEHQERSQAAGEKKQ